MRKKVVATITFLVVLVLGSWFLLPQDQRSTAWVKQFTEATGAGLPDAQPPAYPLIRTPPSAELPTATDADLPFEGVSPPIAVDQSDDTVKQAAADLNATFAQWLMPEEQLRKWVVLVNLVAEGKMPTKHRPLDYPLPPFQVVQKEGGLWVDPANEGRADSLILSVTAISPQQLARYYHAWEPLLQNAYAELGIGGLFRDRLLQAFARILAVKPLQEEFELKLKEDLKSYAFADATLENASAVEKFLWRLGAANTKRVQHYVRQLQPLIFE